MSVFLALFDEEVGRYRVKGDVDKACYEKALAYTPNPGGVGPMTRAMLLEKRGRDGRASAVIALCV